MDNDTQIYFEEESLANPVKGFTKSFQKRSKDKKTEDAEVVELLSYVRDNKVIFGTKVTEKSFKNGTAKKVFVASNCDDLVLKKMKHYGKISGVDVVELNLDSDELSQKLGKPFLISMVCVRDEK